MPITQVDLSHLSLVGQFNLNRGSDENYNDPNYLPGTTLISLLLIARLVMYVGLYLGNCSYVKDDGSDLGGAPDVYAEIDLSLTPVTVPLPGAVLLLGAGLGRLAYLAA